MTEEQAYIYVVGEVGKRTPVKIGVTTKPPRQRLAAYQSANWREVEYLLRRPVPIERMLVDEFLVHRTLSPWWKKGEWFKVRELADQLGGWDQLVEAAVAGDVPGGERFELASADGVHRLAGMKRVGRIFEISCSCGHRYVHGGRLPKAIEQFAATHLEVDYQRPFFQPRRVAARDKRKARNRPEETGVTVIATERWTLERWTGGPDPDDLGQSWACKPAVFVDGRRSCPELAVLARLKLDGWDGVWVNSYRRELRQDWFPAPAVSIVDVAPADVAATFERLRVANGGLRGFLDVFAWRDGEVRFIEVKFGRDKWEDNQQRFVDTAVGIGHDPTDFLLVEVTQLTNHED